MTAFPAIGFQHDFCNSFGKKNGKPKKRKSLKIYVFLRKNNDFEGSPDQKKNAHQQKTATKTIVFLLFFFVRKTPSKAIPNSNGTENRRKSQPTQSPDELFRSRACFSSILGLWPGPQNRKNRYFDKDARPPGRNFLKALLTMLPEGPPNAKNVPKSSKIDRNSLKNRLKMDRIIRLVCGQCACKMQEYFAKKQA